MNMHKIWEPLNSYKKLSDLPKLVEYVAGSSAVKKRERYRVRRLQAKELVPQIPPKATGSSEE